MTSKPTIPTPDWREWNLIPEVEVWQACALSLNIEPHSLKNNAHAWMAEPEDHPLFTDESFPTKVVEDEFERRIRMLLANKSGPHFSPAKIHMVSPRKCGVRLSEFAHWAQHIAKLELPPELKNLAAPPPTEKTATKVAPLVREQILNDRGIDWVFWVDRMPRLSTAQAARLMCALDPEIFENLDSRPNDNDSSSACNRARRMQMLADAQGKKDDTAAGWTRWADENEFIVHELFRESAARKAASETASPEAAAQPAKHIPKQALQEKLILEALVRAGHNPKALPKPPSGRPGVKAQMSELLLKAERQAFPSNGVFEKAWDRLRRYKDIADAE